MTSNSFITDKAWLKIVPTLCKSIHNQEVIQDHPYWWVLLSLYSFVSHVNLPKSHEIIARYKIIIIKEEGNTYHVNQAYDQQVEKYNKKLMRAAVDALSTDLGIKMDQR